ncbi:IclR family transcriptional regulator [Rhodococcus sp. MSC1_016]|jgi:DNA-binding IclR family transcriptional regulator|uniref:IclR family transcriptional regulator n=1 Tax=Rhodococcus sp. MSC1_016 TaxID=2909266 RepID=UPI002030CE73|nr:IclR family transcriptional regulator C-terminal domain-containing protein [Rhodococcus sp. MSC1_016]
MSADDRALSGRQPKAVTSALRVLEEVARAGSGVTAKDIAARLSMPSATTYRLLNILVGEGYVVRLPDLSGFALGQKVGILVDAAVVPTVCAAAREALAELRLSVRFGVHLFFYTNVAVRTADADPEYPPPEDESFLNQHLYACAVGKLLLAEKSELESVIPRWEPRSLTARTIVARSELLANLDLIRSQGFATQLAELRDASACIAVPIRSDTGALIASIALSGHVDHHHLMLRHVPTLQEQAGRLGQFIA